jgi:hypothetical protein
MAGQEIIAWNPRALPLKSPPELLGKQKSQDQPAEVPAARADRRKQRHSGVLRGTKAGILRD